MGFEPTISCLGSKRSTTELHPRAYLYTRERPAAQVPDPGVIIPRAAWAGSVLSQPLPAGRMLGQAGGPGVPSLPAAASPLRLKQSTDLLHETDDGAVIVGEGEVAIHAPQNGRRS